MDLGLSRAGFEAIDCIEVEPDAVESIRRNRSSLTDIAPADMNQICPSSYRRSLGLRRKELDVLAAGPPCQPFSSAARWAKSAWRGAKDPRAHCIDAFFALMEELLPRVVIVENVPGFVRGEKSMMSALREALSRINSRNRVSYALQCAELNAAHYGVAQHRRRAIVIVTRDGSQVDWPEATYRDKPVRAYDALRALELEDKPRARGKWADLLPSIPEGHNYLWHTDRGAGRNLFGYRTRYWSFLLKLAKAEPSWTLSAQPGPSTGPFHWENRPLAIAEALRLQSFPASYKVAGSYRVQLKQVGNATPPLLAEVIGRRIGEDLFGLSYDAPPTLRITRAREIPPRHPVRAVHKKYISQEKVHQAHPGVGLGPHPRIAAA
jgi:DNA (cytosine-5)-methyltransferase 1